ncbi:MAG: hypothetical protein K2K09_04615 [Lachnospiraceae bacterium]|nr:hypothetical protein [Lachnospiraceae bacterium]
MSTLKERSNEARLEKQKKRRRLIIIITSVAAVAALIVAGWYIMEAIRTKTYTG